MLDRHDEDDFRAAAADFDTKRRRPIPLPHARLAVRRLLARKGFAQIGQRQELEAAWKRIIPEEFQERTRCGRLLRGVLEVTVADSLTLSELTFQKRQLLRSLAESKLTTTIKDLRFRIGETD